MHRALKLGLILSLCLFLVLAGVGAGVGSYFEDWDDESLAGYTTNTDGQGNIEFVSHTGEGSALKLNVSDALDEATVKSDTMYTIGTTGVWNVTMDWNFEWSGGDTGSHHARFVLNDTTSSDTIQVWSDASTDNELWRVRGSMVSDKQGGGSTGESGDTGWVDVKLSLNYTSDRAILFVDGTETVNTSLTGTWNDPDSIAPEYDTDNPNSVAPANLDLRFDNVEFDSGSEGATGTVTNNKTGDPINNADVEVFHADNSTVAASTTTDSNGDYSVDLADGDYFIRYKKQGLYYRNITYTNVPPTVDIDVQLDPVPTNYFNATPRGGEYVRNRSTGGFNVSIETREPTGQNSQVTSRFMWYNETSGAWEQFNSISWNTNGGTKVTHDFESPHDWNAGANKWFVNTSTDRGNFHSSNYTFISPGNITLVNASDTSQVITTDTFDVTLSSLDSSFQKTISTSDGKVDLNDIPREDYNVEITQTAGSNTWRDRNLIIDDTEISALWTVAVVNDTVFTNEPEWYSQEFELVDETGQWPPRNVYLLLEQRVGGEFEIVTGDLFGVQNSVELDVNDSEDYRMTLLHAVRGDTRHMGTFTGNSTASDEVITITVTGTVGNPDEDDLEGYHIDAYIDGNRDPTVTPFLRFEYNDPEELTTNLEFTVYEKGNESHILQNMTNVSFDQLGKTTFTQTVTNQEANMTWVVDWSGTRNGTSISGKIIVGGDRLDPGVDMPATWMHWGATIFIILIGGLFGGSVNARLGVIVTPMVAGIFYVTGWLPQSYTIGIVIFTLILGGMVLVANHQLGD